MLFDNLFTIAALIPCAFLVEKNVQKYVRGCPVLPLPGSQSTLAQTASHRPLACAGLLVSAIFRAGVNCLAMRDDAGSADQIPFSYRSFRA